VDSNNQPNKNLNMSTLQIDQAQRVDIVCRRGDTFKMALNVTSPTGAPVNVTPATSFNYKMEVRETDTATGTIIASGSFTFSGTASGVLTVTVSSTVMAAVDSGLYVYDLQTTRVSDSFVQTWIYGTFKINEDVTVN
jgi:hypothetical protein